MVCTKGVAPNRETFVSQKDLVVATDYRVEQSFDLGRRQASPNSSGRGDFSAVMTSQEQEEARAPFDMQDVLSRFRPDLTQLHPFEGAVEEEARSARRNSDDFFHYLKMLLQAVRAGDIARAQAVADCLELDAWLGVNVETSAPVQAPKVVEIPIGEDTSSAYDTLRHYSHEDGDDEED